MKNDGYKNEYDFVLAINNKKVNELNPLLKSLIKGIFYKINDDDLIKCWRNHLKQKSDIMIKIGPAIKGVSIKMGYKNSIHTEKLSTFIEFLKENNIPKEVYNIYLKYHFGDGTTNGKGNIRHSSTECKDMMCKELALLNSYLNNNKLILNAVKRFILFGNNSEYSIDALVYGTPNDFFWLKPKDILDIHEANVNNNALGPHIGKLYIQPFNRCINHNKKYELYRYYIQIKWYNIGDDIMKYYWSVSLKI